MAPCSVYPRCMLRWGVCKPLGLLFLTWGNTGLDTHTAWHAVYNCDRHIWFQREPLRLLNFTADSELTWNSQYTNCISLHATSKISSDSVNNFSQPLAKWTLPLQLHLILGWFYVSKTTGISSDDHCLSICLTSFRIHFTVSSGVLSSNPATESDFRGLFLSHHSILVVTNRLPNSRLIDDWRDRN